MSEELKHIYSKYLIREEETDGHSPMKFLCSDNMIYYCKYRVTPKKEETDFLVYEIVCHYLLKHFNIPTPNIALVELTKNSFDPGNLRRNKLYAKPGVVCFGSQHIDSYLVNDALLIDSKTAFNRLANPADLIKIAIFDLWVSNTDRGKKGNFNLLVSTEAHKSVYFAFDNAFTFGGEMGLGIFNSSFGISLADKLMNTEYFRSIIKYIPKSERFKIAQNMLSLCHDENVRDTITTTSALIPGTWNTLPGLYPRIIEFLSSAQRLQKIEQLVYSSLSTF
jgi:hypothetical protein